jgi:hypothetical protein
MNKTPRDTKLCISQLIIIQILTFLPFLSTLQYIGWIKQLSLKTVLLHNAAAHNVNITGRLCNLT